MNANPCGPVPPVPPLVSLWIALQVAWRRFAQRRALARICRRDVQALSALDDHQLKDIGFSREQVDKLALERSWQCASVFGAGHLASCPCAEILSRMA